MQLTQTERNTLSLLVEILREKLGASRILLYGSAARGELQESSDIDLLVILPKVTWELEKEVVDCCFQAELKCGRTISASCFSTDELSQTPLRVSPFVLNANRDGVEL